MRKATKSKEGRKEGMRQTNCMQGLGQSRQANDEALGVIPVRGDWCLGHCGRQCIGRKVDLRHFEGDIYKACCWSG